MNVGEMLFVRGLYSPAFTFTFKSIRICESDGFDDLMPRLQNTMGNIYNAYNEKTCLSSIMKLPSEPRVRHISL